MVVYYNLDSDDKFLWSVDGTYLWVSQIDDLNAKLVKSANWRHTDVSIGPRDKHQGLKTLGVEVSGSLLKDLAERLAGSLLMVNREGFCFVNVAPLTDPSLGIEYYRLNDLFDWSAYGVRPSIRTRWGRWGVDTGAVIVGAPGRVEEHEKETRDRLTGQKSTHGDRDDGDDSDNGLDPIAAVNYLKTLIPSTKFRVSSLRQRFPLASTSSSAKLPELTPLEEVGQRLPASVVVHTTRGGFDRDQWWAIMARSGNERCFLAFYGGSRTIIEFDEGETSYVPYDDDGQALTADREFFLARLQGFGICLAFKYT